MVIESHCCLLFFVILRSVNQGIVERYYSGLLYSFYCNYSYHMYIHGCNEISGTVTFTLSRGEHLFRANFIDF